MGAVPVKGGHVPSLSKFPRCPPPAHTGRVGSNSFTKVMSLLHKALASGACLVKTVHC